MFEKFLSLVPYNPGMVHHLAFYGRRMREEASIRRLGTVFLVLAFVVQSIAVINPPASASQCSDNDMLPCGLTSNHPAQEAHDKCVANKNGYMAALHYYGISCKSFDSAKPLEIHTDGQNYFSGGYFLSPAKDHPRPIDGAGTLYWRDFSVWSAGAHVCADDSTRSDCWSALRIQDQDDNTWYVLINCGNLVWPKGVPEGNQLRTLTSEDTISVIGTPTTTTSKTNSPVQGDQGVQNPSAERSPYIPEGTTTVPVFAEAHPVNPCKFNPSIDANDYNCPDACETNPQIPATSDQCFYPCPYNGSIQDTDSACKPCDKSTDFSDSKACVTVHKTASNLSQNIADANNSTAKPGDIITYTLYAQNTSQAPVYDFVFQENLGDVLDYADVVDAHGGTLAADKVMAWPVRDLDEEASASVQVTVKVKDPIPQTPVASNNPGGFDMIMTNVYGNSVNIKLPAAPAKSVELAATKLPNTGPGTTLFIAASIVILAGYFYSRSSLLAKESDIAIKEQV